MLCNLPLFIIFQAFQALVDWVRRYLLFTFIRIDRLIRLQLDLTNLLRVKLSKKMITEEKTFLLIFL